MRKKLHNYFKFNFTFRSTKNFFSAALITMTQGQVQIFSQPSPKSNGEKTEVLYEGQYWKSQRAQFGDKIATGSIVHTGTNGKLRMILPNSDVINVGPSSSVKVGVEQDKTGATKAVEVDVIYGKLRAVAQKEEKEKKNFKVKTTAAVMGVRGTDFMASFNPAEGQIQLSVLRGEVELQPTTTMPQNSVPAKSVGTDTNLDAAKPSLEKSVSVKSGSTALLQVSPSLPNQSKDSQTNSAKSKIASNISPKLELKTTSQESLIEIQNLTDIKSKAPEPSTKISENLKKEVQQAEAKAKEKTIETIKIEDPKLYEKLQLTPAKDINEIQSAAVSQAIQSAPVENPEKLKKVKLKKQKEENLEGEDEIYNKYFKKPNR